MWDTRRGPLLIHYYVIIMYHINNLVGRVHVGCVHETQWNNLAISWGRIHGNKSGQWVPKSQAHSSWSYWYFLLGYLLN